MFVNPIIYSCIYVDRMARKRFSVAEVVSKLQADDSSDDEDIEQFAHLSEANDVVAGANGEVDIVIVPPDTVDAVSDEEFVDEDDLLPSTLPLDVPGPVAVFLHTDGVQDSATSTNTHQQGSKAKKKKISTTTAKWGKKVTYSQIIPTVEMEKVGDKYPDLVGMSPYELFRKYYDDELTKLIVDESNRYAQQKNNSSFKLDVEDLDVFVGILLLSGYHSLPRERLYWSRDEDVKISFVSSYMARNRFLEIKRYVHLADNDAVVANDKLYKVRSFLTLLNTSFQQFGVFSKFLSVDEQMVPYYGHHSAKMYIRGKPIRFGYKLWVLAADRGYPFNVQVYCGKLPTSVQHESLGLGHTVVTSLLSCVSNPMYHEVYFDNFFTSYSLLSSLTELKIKAAGTVRDNRLRGCPIMDNKLMKKTERGFFHVQCDKTVMAVKWHDNQCVTVATNFSSVEPLGKAKRWSSAKKSVIDLSQPAVIRKYNEHMGGVDILDRFMSNYRPVFRSKKWWWPLFVNGLNMAVTAAWRLHVEVGGNFDHLAFRRYIVRTLLKRSDKPPTALSGPGSHPVDDVRFDGVGHHLTPSSRQARCRLCKKNARLHCSKCEVPLHLHCEEQYHAKI